MRNPDLFPEVLQAVAGKDRTVYAYMNDGTVHLCDIKPLIDKGGVFEKLKNENFFRKVTVMNDTVAWDLSGVRDPADCIDLDPVWVIECPLADDPLEENNQKE